MFSSTFQNCGDCSIWIWFKETFYGPFKLIISFLQDGVGINETSNMYQTGSHRDLPLRGKRCSVRKYNFSSIDKLLPVQDKQFFRNIYIMRVSTWCMPDESNPDSDLPIPSNAVLPTNGSSKTSTLSNKAANASDVIIAKDIPIPSECRL